MTAEPDAISRILGVLKEHPDGLIIVEIAEKSGLNRMSVAKYLEVLTALESVEFEICGRAKVYSLSRRLPMATFLGLSSKHYCITDSNLRVVQFHDCIPSTVDITPREIDGVLLPDMLRDRIVNFADCMKAFRKALAGEPSTVLVEDLYNGKRKFFEIHHMPIRFLDGSLGMMAISQEITDRKLVEIELHQKAERFQAMVEGMAYPVFRAGTDSILTYLSPRAVELGLAPDTCTGRPFSYLAVQEDREAVDAGLQVIPESVEGSFCFRVRGPVGGTILLEAVCTAQRDPSGTCTGIVGLLRDVTEDTRPARKQTPLRDG